MKEERVRNNHILLKPQTEVNFVKIHLRRGTLYASAHIMFPVLLLQGPVTSFLVERLDLHGYFSLCCVILCPFLRIFAMSSLEKLSSFDIYICTVLRVWVWGQFTCILCGMRRFFPRRLRLVPFHAGSPYWFRPFFELKFLTRVWYC